MATAPLKTTTLRCRLDATGHDRSQAQQGRQVEDVRTKDNPGTNRRLVVHQGGD